MLVRNMKLLGRGRFDMLKCLAFVCAVDPKKPLRCCISCVPHAFLTEMNSHADVKLQARENKLVAADLLALELRKKQAAEAGQQEAVTVLGAQKAALQDSISQRRLEIKVCEYMD